MTPDCAEHELAMLEHRHLAHLVELEVLGRARAAVEEVDPDRLPVGAVELEHERDLVGVAGLGEAVELVFGHGSFPSVVVRAGPVRSIHSARPMISFMISFVPP